ATTGYVRGAGTARLKSPSGTITADSIEYDPTQGKVIATGHVTILTGQVKATADQVVYAYTGKVLTVAPNPNAAARANSPGRQVLIAKLSSIRIDEIKFDHLPLSEALHILHDEVQKRDPDGRGINFIMNPSTTVNPPAGIVSTNPAAEEFDLSAVPITITTLHNVRVA